MDSASPSPIFYAGEFRHQLDDKHRLTIPARWRRGSAGEDFIIVPEPHHQYLLVMSPTQFARLSDSAENAPDVSPRDRRVFLRQLHSRALHGSSDRQGRLVLPDELCKQFSLNGEVAVIGGRGRFEVWNLGRWKRAQEEETPTYQHVANVVGL
jgi:MraZ protein